jgi:putative two-component system response regulator
VTQQSFLVDDGRAMLDAVQHSLFQESDAVVQLTRLSASLHGAFVPAGLPTADTGADQGAGWHGDGPMPSGMHDRLRMAAEFFDTGMWNHVARVGQYSRVIAATMGMHKSFVKTLFMAAPLHDIGKIGIPESILLKPGPLSDEEWDIMVRHCEIGARILRAFAAQLRPSSDSCFTDVDFSKSELERQQTALEMAASVALTHHEHWDGGGYPQGLAGEAIPLESRIVAIADVFDALTSDRPYRLARPEEEALSIIDATVGSHFDPYVHVVFMRSLPAIRTIRNQLSDETNMWCSEGVLPMWVEK